MTHASVTVDEETISAIEGGLLILLGVAPDDGPQQVAWLSKKVATLRIFEDEAGKMNRSLLDIDGSALVVSQFTLLGDCRKGRRPSFVGAAPPDLAQPLYESFCEALSATGVRNVERGRFGAHMRVSLLNDGPVTLVIDT